jgi:hypothetical protein
VFHLASTLAYNPEKETVMKKIIFTLCLFMGISTACDILEPEPFTALDANRAIVSGSSAEAALLGAYANMQNSVYYGIEFVCNNDLLADNAIYQGFFDSQLELDSKTVPFTNLFIGSVWVRIYRVINITNLLLTVVPELDDPNFSTAARNRLLGQAHAIRALAYFDLLRYFGEHFDNNSAFGLPLLLTTIPDNDFNQIPDLPRATVAATYAQIMSDLEAAVGANGEPGLLPVNFRDNGLMNYWAAKSLRARVNLYRRQYQAAFDEANEIITGSGFSLVANVEDLYGTEPTIESIFDLEFNDQDQSSFNTFLIRRDEYNVDPSLLAAFEPGDARRALFDRLRNADRCFKYPDGTGADNAKIFRVAEIYFIRAEAAAMSTNNPNAGLDDLNTIRQRAGLDPLAGFNDMDAFVDALLQERRIELSYEGHRFFDLVRLNKTQEVLGINEAFRRIMPIPRDELQVTNMAQNPGYENL